MKAEEDVLNEKLKAKIISESSEESDEAIPTARAGQRNSSWQESFDQSGPHGSRNHRELLSDESKHSYESGKIAD